MEFRRSEYGDIEEIMEIIDKAKSYLKNQNIDQWQMGYPNSESIKEDVDNKESYVLLDKEKIVATTGLSFRGDKNYDNIYDGKWITDEAYAVIHRVAVDMDLRGKGLAGEMMREIEKTCIANGISSIKVDTHRHNIAMKKYLEKNDFKYCGIIYLEDGNERLAYEKILLI